MPNRRFAALVAGAFLAASPALAGLGRPSATNVDGVPTLSGGVGEDERKTLEAIDDHYNLKLVFAVDGGALVSDVEIAVTNADGLVLLDTTAGGPWFYAQLPKGEYGIAAEKDGTSVERRVRVGWGSQTTVEFDWDEDDLRTASR